VGKAISPHVNNAYNSAAGIGNSMTGLVVYVLRPYYDAGRACAPYWEKTREFVKNIPFCPGGGAGRVPYREPFLVTLYKDTASFVNQHLSFSRNDTQPAPSIAVRKPLVTPNLTMPNGNKLDLNIIKK